MSQLATSIFRFMHHIGFRAKAQPLQHGGEPVITKLVYLLGSKQYQRVDKFFSRLPPDQYSNILYNLVQVEGVEKMIDRWKRRTESVHALTASGLAMIDQAWRIQGGFYVRNAPDIDWTAFSEKLLAAEKVLGDASKYAPANPEPMGILLISGIGLELDREVMTQRLEQVKKISPLHYRAHTNMLKGLKPRWNRHDQDMFDFARATSATAPEGDGLHTLVVLAHFERYSQLSRLQTTKPINYFASADIRYEVLSAYSRSLGSPDYIQTAFTSEQSNWFCAALHLCGARNETQQEIMRMRNRYTMYPWRAMTKRVWEKHDHGWIVDRVRRESGLTRNLEASTAA